MAKSHAARGPFGRDQVEEVEQLAMVAPSLSFTKEPEAGFGNVDNIFLGLHGEPETHCQSPVTALTRARAS